MGKWNARYVAYAISQGAVSPEEMIEREKAAGGHFGYMAWIQRKWLEWEAATGRATTGWRTEKDHADFDIWLGHDCQLVSAPVVAKNDTPPRMYWFGDMSGYGIGAGASIFIENPEGGDPCIVAEIKRVYRQDELNNICRLANQALASPVPTGEGR